MAGFGLSEYSYLFGLQWVLLLLVGVALARLREANAQSFRQVIYDSFIVKPIKVIAVLFRRLPMYYNDIDD